MSGGSDRGDSRPDTSDSASGRFKARMLDATHDLITLVDRGLRYVEANRAYLEARGMTRDQVIGATVPELWGAAVLESAFSQAIERAFTGERVRYEASFEIAPGELRHLEVFYEPVVDPRGSIDHVVITTRDRSDSERAERALRALREESEGARRRAETNLAEMRQKLSVSLGRLHEALYGGEATPELRLRSARVAADDALAWLEASAPDLVGSTSPAGPLDLAIVLEQVFANGRAEAQSRGLALVLEPPQGALPIRESSPRALRQRLERLIEEGLSRNGSGTLLILRATETPAGVRVELVPTGALVEAARTGGLTGPRFAAPGPGASEAPSGDSGMGAEATPSGGWRLWIDLRGEGADNWTREKARPRAAGRILVVDDHAVNRRLCRELLEARGVGVDEADSGESALAAIERNDYDAVLLDCRMSPIDGFEVARRVRARESDSGGRHLPLVAMTAGALAEDRERCSVAGMDAYLTKPLRVAELEETLQRLTRGVLGERRAPALDPRYVESLSDPSDPGLFAELARLYLEESGERMAALERAVAQGDAEAVRAGAHGLRGASSSIGATLLAAELQRLERAADDFAARADSLAAVREEMQRVSAELERHA